MNLFALAGRFRSGAALNKTRTTTITGGSLTQILRVLQNIVADGVVYCFENNVLVDSLINSSYPTVTSESWESGLSNNMFNPSTALRLMVAISAEIVVIGGVQKAANGISSHPEIMVSRGTTKPDSWQARSAPKASKSFIQIMASGGALFPS